MRRRCIATYLRFTVEMQQRGWGCEREREQFRGWDWSRTTHVPLIIQGARSRYVAIKRSSTVQGQDHVPHGLVTQLHRSLVSRYALTERWMHHHGRIVSNWKNTVDGNAALGRMGMRALLLEQSNAPVVPSISPGICSLDHPYFTQGRPTLSYAVPLPIHLSYLAHLASTESFTRRSTDPATRYTYEPAA